MFVLFCFGAQSTNNGCTYHMCYTYPLSLAGLNARRLFQWKFRTTHLWYSFLFFCIQVFEWELYIYIYTSAVSKSLHADVECVCVLNIKPFFLPVDIQHNQYPCRFSKPVAPVVQVVNLEFYLFESWVRAPGGSDFDFICKNKNKKGFNC